MDSYKITIETFNKKAAVYQDKFMDLDLYNDAFDVFCKLIEKPGAGILELGCGPGNVTRYLLSKRPDFKIEAIDLAPNMIQLAKENNPSADFRIMDCREIDKLPGPYSGIISGFCLPYLSKADCAKLIKDCDALLPAGGILWLSTMEGDYSASGFETSSDGQDRAYIHYHEADYLQQYLTENSFELISLIRKPYPKPDGTFSTDMIFIAQKVPAPHVVN